MKTDMATNRRKRRSLNQRPRKMPSKSKAQSRLMAAAAHNPAFAKKVGIPVGVAKDFNKADKGKKFKEGGPIMASKAKLNKLFKGTDKPSEELKEARAIKSGKISPEEYAKGEKMEKAKGYKAGGVTKTVPTSKEMGSLGMKCGGKVKKMAKGGGCEVKGKTKGRFV